MQDQGTANVLLSNVSISIDWAAASSDGNFAASSSADITSVVVKVGDVDLKIAGASLLQPPSSSPPPSPPILLATCLPAFNVLLQGTPRISFTESSFHSSTPVRLLNRLVSPSSSSLHSCSTAPLTCVSQGLRDIITSQMSSFTSLFLPQMDLLRFRAFCQGST